MFNFGFNADLIVTIVITMLVIVFMIIKTYRGGVKQSIQLHHDKIIFDYLIYETEFRFESSSEWELERVGKNWRLTAFMDGSSKLIPISAFPNLLSDVGAFYNLTSVSQQKNATPHVRSQPN